MGYWNNTGYVANTKEYYVLEIQKLFVEAFGSDFLLDETLPQGILITRLAELFYNADMDGIEAFSRLNPNSASGVYLDILGMLRGYTRNTGIPQVATVQLTVQSEGFQPFTIQEGTTFTTTSSGEVFVCSTPQLVNSTDAIISLDYSSTGNSFATVNETLSTDGYSQITNMVITYLADGTDVESDLDYRARILTTFPVASNTIQSVRQLLMANQYVKFAGVNYNDSDETVGGIGPYCTEWIVAPKDGTGDPVAYLNLFKNVVGTIIVNNKMPGAPTDGNTSVTVTDVFGTQKTVNFSIPDKVELEIVVTVSTPETTGILDLTNADTERQQILDYINTLGINKDVSFSRCMSYLTTDAGYDVVEFKMRRKDVPGTWYTNTNMSIGLREYASVALADISIGV